MAAIADVVILGQALNDFGFEANNTIEGLGLNTFGFLWPCSGIWNPAAETTSTTWVDCSTGVTLTTEYCVS